jgi:hypothetical protein
MQITEVIYVCIVRIISTLMSLCKKWKYAIKMQLVISLEVISFVYFVRDHKNLAFTN